MGRIPHWISVVGLAILVSGCAAPPAPIEPPSESSPIDCNLKTVLKQVAYHNWTLTEDTDMDFKFAFANLTELTFTLTLEAEGTIFYDGSGRKPTDWHLDDPDGRRVWEWISTGGAFPDPGTGTKAVYVVGAWETQDLPRVTGNWTLHLDGHSNAQGTIELVGTSTPCEAAEFTETVVEE